MENNGYVYCCFNQSMPGTTTVRITQNEKTLIKIFSKNEIMLVKKVHNPKNMQKLLCNALKYHKTVYARVYKTSHEMLKSLFDLMDGEYITPKRVNKENIYCRDMIKCFTDGQRIRHTIGDNIIKGTYDSTYNKIIYNKKLLSLNKFATGHYKMVSPQRNPNCNAWLECECKINKKWVSTYNLQPYII